MSASPGPEGDEPFVSPPWETVVSHQKNRHHRRFDPTPHEGNDAMTTTIDFFTGSLCECFGDVPCASDFAPTMPAAKPRTSPAKQRAEDMSRRFADGETLQLIARSYGVTRERVRQIIGRHGTVTVADARAARERSRQEDRTRLGQWAAQVLRSEPGLTIDELAKRLGHTRADVNASLDEDSRRLLVQVHPSHKLWNETDIVAALQLAAEVVGGSMSRVKYDSIRREFDGPSGVLILQRFGSWQVACAAAGIEMGRRRPGGYTRNWTDAQVLDFVVAYLADPAERGTFDGYSRWASSTPGSPSGPTVRNYLGAWSTVKRDALALLVAGEQRAVADSSDVTDRSSSCGRVA